MADEGVFIKNADIQARAGAGASATYKAVAETDKYVKDVEASINTQIQYNFSDNYASLNADAALLLKDIGACICAMYVIMNDMSGYPSVEVATKMLDVLYDRAMKGLATLQKQTVIDWIKGGATA